MSLEVHHQIMWQVLYALVHLQEKYHDTCHGSSVFLNKFLVQIHFEGFFIGDTEGHYLLCCDYIGYSKIVQITVRCCNVEWDKCYHGNHGLTMVTSDDIFDAVDKFIHHKQIINDVLYHRNIAGDLSLNLHIPVFQDMFWWRLTWIFMVSLHLNSSITFF